MAKSKTTPNLQVKDDGREKLFRVECLDVIHINAVRACMIASIGNLTLGFTHTEYSRDQFSETQTAKENVVDFMKYVTNKTHQRGHLNIEITMSTDYDECHMFVEIRPIDLNSSIWSLCSKDACWDEEIGYLNKAKEFWKQDNNINRLPNFRDPKNPNLKTCLSFLESATKKLNFSTIDIKDTIKIAEAIAKLGESEFVKVEHIAEAIQYSRKKAIFNNVFFNDL